MSFNPLQILISQVLGQTARGVAQTQHGADPQVLLAVHVISRLQEHLFGRWAMAQSMHLPCAVRFQNFHTGQVSACRRLMAGACVVCGEPCCLDHGSIVIDTGDITCFACIEVAKQARAGSVPAQQAPAPDDDKLLKKYLRMLKLKGTPAEDEIRAAYKREAGKAHPDKHPEDKKHKAHERFIELGRARDYLLARVKARAA